jgi:hypothetical protein
MNLKKLETEILLNQQAIKGKLVIGGAVWSFSADDEAFVELFPSHSVCSFSTEGELSDPARRQVHQAVNQKVADIMQNGFA